MAAASPQGRNKSSLSIEAEILLLKYLFGIDHLLPFAQYTSNKDSLGLKNTKLRKACETKKNSLRSVLIDSSGDFIDIFHSRGLEELAREVKGKIKELVEFHRKSRENRRRGAGGPRRNRKSQAEEADDIESVEGARSTHNPNAANMSTRTSRSRKKMVSCCCYAIVILVSTHLILISRRALSRLSLRCRLGRHIQGQRRCNTHIMSNDVKVENDSYRCEKVVFKFPHIDPKDFAQGRFAAEIVADKTGVF
jgi:hypothetical protein